MITKTTSTTVSMYEDLTGNSQGLCAPGGMITLTRTSSGTADMSWQDSTVPGNTATGQLVGG